ncbi:MAG TPA: hypothetical protein VHA56_14600, partial [Mucilaginibacter sp.]|nr:hypothetical protein [Mucilaginibacter sp.]
MNDFKSADQLADEAHPIDIYGDKHRDSNGNWVTRLGDNEIYKFRADVTNQGQTFIWMGEDKGWVTNDKLSDSELEAMYNNYVDAGENPFQGAFGSQIHDWASSSKGLAAGINANSNQLNMAAGVAYGTALAIGGGI